MFYSLMCDFFRAVFTFFFHAELKGKENIPKEGAVILCANHLSNWDPPLLAAYLSRTVNYMAKKELFTNFLFGRALKKLHAFPINRGSADRVAIKMAVNILKQGGVLGLFPEGTRSKTGDLQKAEMGVGLIASMTGAFVVPAAIIGTNKICQKGSFFAKVSVIYGEPIKFTGNRKNKADLEEFSQLVMSKIAALKNDYEEVKNDKSSA